MAATVATPNTGDTVIASPAVEGSELCSLCCEPIEVVAIGRCNHTLTCATCTLRLRLCYRDNACPFCKTHLKRVYLLKAPTQSRSVNFNQLSKQRHRFETNGSWQSAVWVDKESRIGERSLMDDLIARMAMSCTICDPSAVDVPFDSFKVFRDHLRKSHEGSTVCNVCYQANRYFPRELEIFENDSALDDHLESHPKCEFCGHRYFGRDELFNHMRKKHCLCQLCHSTGDRHVYFQDTQRYIHHLREVHYVCNEPDCVNALIAFNTQQELHAHLLEVHGIRITPGRSNQRRQQRRTIDVRPMPTPPRRFAGNELQQRGGDGFVMIDDDMPPLPTVIPTSTRPLQRIDRPLQQEEFPALPVASASFPPSYPRKVLVRRSCPCGRRSQNVLVEEGTPKESLLCDDTCEAIKRRARLAEAFNIDTSTYAGAFESNFSIDLITWARQYPKRVEAIERQLQEKITRRNEQRFKLDRIPREWKKLVIEFIDGCGAVGRSIHSSDAVEVILTDRSCLPGKKLTQYASALSEDKYQELVRESLKNVILLEDVVRPINVRKYLITWDGDYEFEWMTNSIVKLTFRTESSFRSAVVGLAGGVKDVFRVHVPLKPEKKPEESSNTSSFPSASERRPWSLKPKEKSEATEKVILENSFEVLSRL